GYGAQLCQGDCQDLKTVDGNVLADGLHLDVSEGIISVTNGGGTTLFRLGDFGYVTDNQTLPVKVSPGSGIQAPNPNFNSGPKGGGADAECQV
ncbi:MAG: FecR family protein, partial [Burkholderiales bacterium]